MQNENLIAANEFCTAYHLEMSFIYSLQQYGLIEVTTVDEQTFILTSQLPVVERIARLHYDLDINLEGIDAITHLLNQVEKMQNEIANLKNKLRLYED